MMRVARFSSSAPSHVRAFSKCPFAEIVKATAPVVAPHVPDIVNDFYPRMFRQNPETKAFFNLANQFKDPPLQRLALGNAVVAYASNIEDLTPLAGAVDIIAHKHCGLSVAPEHYSIVHKNLMESIGHVLGDAVTPEIGEGWSEAVLSLAKILYEKEEELYKMAEGRSGGWRGAKDFKLVEKRAVSHDCVEFTFEAVDGAVPIDFTPGQFLTLHLKKEGATPRHYTATSKPGDAFLKCCVKKVEGGFVSESMHDMVEGEVVGMAAPFGVFGMKDDAPAVLISAGIGATPMKSFLLAHPEKINFALHVDRTEAAHPFKELFENVPHSFHYTEQAGSRPSAESLVNEDLKPFLADNNFYLCGPDAFMHSMKEALTAAGARGVYSEAFGPELASA